MKRGNFNACFGDPSKKPATNPEPALVRVGQCAKRGQYETRDAAEQAAAFWSKDMGQPHKAYKCGSCRQWHITKVKVEA